MAFVWTYPDPLDPNTYQTEIYGKLRNEIFSYKVYFQEIQDAVDTLRQNVDIPAYNNWISVQNDPITGISPSITGEMYTQIRDKIDDLLPLYGYDNGVIDILNRNWSDYYIRKSYSGNDRVAPYQLLQDFRTVLDALLIKLEQWIITNNYLYPQGIETPFLTNQETNEDTYGSALGWQEGAYKEVFVIGDLGTWNIKSFDGQSNRSPNKKFGYPGDEGYVNFDVSYLPEQADSELVMDLLGYYNEQTTVYETTTGPDGRSYYTVEMSNESYLSPFEMKCGWTGDDYPNEFNQEIDLTSNSAFKIEMELSGTNAQVYNSAYQREIGPGVTDTGVRTAYPTLYMRLFFSKFIKDVNYTVQDKDLTTPPINPINDSRYLVLSGDTGTDWFGHSDEIATWNGSSWTFISPTEDMRIKVLDENEYYVYESGNWVILDLEEGTEIADIVFTDDSSFPTNQVWLVYPFDDFNAYIPFNLMTFRNYYSGEEQDYNTRDYDYRWIGIKFTQGRTTVALGSYQEATPSYSQSGQTPSMLLTIDKIGIQEVI